MKYICFDIETTGLSPYYGDKITAICARTEDGETFGVSGTNEADMMMQFYSWCAFPTNEYFLLSKNGQQFDIPFLIARAAQWFEAEDFKNFMEVFLSYKHYDMQFVTKKWINMEDVAYLLGCGESITLKMDTPATMFRNNQFKDLLRYCNEHVRITCEAYEALIKLYPEKRFKT